MVRFCVGREEDGAEEGPGPSSSRQCPKRQKTSTVVPPPAAVQVLSEGTDSDCEIEPENEEDDDDDFLEEDDEEEEEEDGFQELEVELEVEDEEPEWDEDPNSDGPVSVTLTDPDVLDCPICLDPLTIPVYQCENGHVACSSCCPKIRRTCPSCSWPIGYNRCRAIEKVLESVNISCKNKRYGCKEIMKYSSKHGHEDVCPFTPCSCPVPGCNFASTAAKLYMHFTTCHSSSATVFSLEKHFSVSVDRTQRLMFLRDEKCRIYVLNNYSETNETSVINIVQIAPVNSARPVYELKAKYEDTSIALNSCIESIPKWLDCHPGKKALRVPNFYATSSGQTHLKICIWRREQSSAH